MPTPRPDLSAVLPATGFLKPVGDVLQKALSLDRLLDVCNRAGTDRRTFFDRLLESVQVSIRLSPEDLERIPKTGPVVLVANHPFGLVEGCALGSVLLAVRPDARLLANSLLAEWFPEVCRDWLFPVNPFGTEEATRENLGGMRRAMRHVKDGGLLAVFPAGEVAHVNFRQRSITDPPWSETIARVVRATKASVLPVFFDGANSAMFQVLGMMHPKVRTAMLPNELFNKQHGHVEMRTGSLIDSSRLAEFRSDAEMMQYLRHRTYLLKHRMAPMRPEGKPKFSFPSNPFRTPLEPVVAAIDRCSMEREIEALPPERRLASMNSCDVYYAWQHEIPGVLREIGRLREITFRESGEGTGKSIDIDEFDAHYIHLFIWDGQAREVVGAYRLGQTDRIFATHGRRGLYTSRLFEYGTDFLDRLGPALEMGRSFVRIEHQKSFGPLLLLWKGIGAFVVANPRYKMLFGPVSISNDYRPMSRQLMVNFFRGQNRSEELSRLVRARSPFRRRPAILQAEDDVRPMAAWDIEDLSAAVADIETGSKGIPVLLRQYLKLGGKLLSFSVDRHFRDALDGLILVDLRETDLKMLSRYMGKDGVARFLEHC